MSNILDIKNYVGKDMDEFTDIITNELSEDIVEFCRRYTLIGAEADVIIMTASARVVQAMVNAMLGDNASKSRVNAICKRLYENFTNTYFEEED